MSHVKVEIASQPDCWLQAAKLADSPGLPLPGERVAVVGCGTSWFMAKAYAALREQSALGETDAFQASEFPLGRRYDRVVAITRSGTTTEVIELLDALHGRTPTTVITADGAEPAAAVAGDAVGLGFAGPHPPHPPPTPPSRPPRWPGTRWSSTSPTSCRWCRPASPPAPWPCC